MDPKPFRKILTAFSKKKFTFFKEFKWLILFSKSKTSKLFREFKVGAMSKVEAKTNWRLGCRLLIWKLSCLPKKTTSTLTTCLEHLLNGFGITAQTIRKQQLSFHRSGRNCSSKRSFRWSDSIKRNKTIQNLKHLEVGNPPNMMFFFGPKTEIEWVRDSVGFQWKCFDTFELVARFEPRVQKLYQTKSNVWIPNRKKRARAKKTG